MQSFTHSIMYISVIFLIFAVTHSLCVTNAAKTAAARFLGEGRVKATYRFLFTCFSVVSISAVLFLIRSIPDTPPVLLPFWVKTVFAVFQATGVVILILAIRTINIFEFVGIAQLVSYFRYGKVSGDIEGIQGNSLVTSGIYQITRHPLYLGAFLLVTFNTQPTLNSLTFAVLADLYFIIGAVIEEKRLEEKFGEDYARYKEETSRFIPSVKKLFFL